MRYALTYLISPRVFFGLECRRSVPRPEQVRRKGRLSKWTSNRHKIENSDVTHHHFKKPSEDSLQIVTIKRAVKMFESTPLKKIKKNLKISTSLLFVRQFQTSFWWRYFLRESKSSKQSRSTVGSSPTTSLRIPPKQRCLTRSSESKCRINYVFLEQKATVRYLM